MGQNKDPVAQSHLSSDRGILKQVLGCGSEKCSLFSPKVYPSLFWSKHNGFHLRLSCLHFQSFIQSRDESHPLTHQVLGPRPGQSILVAMTGSGINIRSSQPTGNQIWPQICAPTLRKEGSISAGAASIEWSYFQKESLPENEANT